MLHRKEESFRNKKSNVENWEEASILELRGEIRLKYLKIAKCLNTFGAHCSPKSAMHHLVSFSKLV